MHTTLSELQRAGELWTRPRCDPSTEADYESTAARKAGRFEHDLQASANEWDALALRFKVYFPSYR